YRHLLTQAHRIRIFRSNRAINWGGFANVRYRIVGDRGGPFVRPDRPLRAGFVRFLNPRGELCAFPILVKSLILMGLVFLRLPLSSSPFIPQVKNAWLNMFQFVP